MIFFRFVVSNFQPGVYLPGCAVFGLFAAEALLPVACCIAIIARFS